MGQDRKQFSLVEKTNGPHYGKVWRNELMTEQEAIDRNSKIDVMKWEPVVLQNEELNS